MGKIYGQRPSSWLGLPPDSWEAYQFDFACMNFGIHVENKLSERRKDGSQRYSLAELLADEKTPAREQYRSAAGLVVEKVQINEDGTW